MIKSKKQIHRLLRLVGELKQNRYPNCASFVKKMRKADIDENLNLACSTKTVMRDVKLLKEEYGAPIEFDQLMKGYYLKNNSWDFNVPLFDENFLLSAVLGAKTAEDIIPEPLKSEIRESVDNVIASNNPDFLDTALINSFIIASGVKVKIKPNVFKVLFSGWVQRKAVNIKYASVSGETNDRQVDPDILTYYNNVWYIKGYCHLRNEIRTFAVHRITQAELTEKTFEPDVKLNKYDLTVWSPLMFNLVENIEIWISPEIKSYVLEKKEMYDQKTVQNEDGSLILYISKAPKHDIIKWVLSEGGNMKVIEPKRLAEEVRDKAEKVFLLHS